MEISQVFQKFNMLTVKVSSETPLFSDWSNQVFDSL